MRAARLYQHEQGLGNRLRQVPLPVAAFLVALVLPTLLSVHVGALRISPYRLVLLVMFVPCLLRWLGGRCGPILLCDLLLMAHAGWVVLSLCVVHGLSRGIESGGIYAIEVVGPYLLARCFVRDARQFRGFATLLVVLVISLIVLALPEALSGRSLLRGDISMDKRLGLSRAAATFEHPILYGVFCASTLGLAWYTGGGAPRRPGSFIRAGLISLATMLSLSTGALAAWILQGLLIVWDRATARLAYRWLVLGSLFVAMYLGVDLLSNRTPMRVALTYLTFSPHTGYHRMATWSYGIQNVQKNPIFGIGFGEWERADWLGSSVDNFWLVVMLRHGVPALMLLAGSIVLIAGSLINTRAGSGLRDMRMGWCTSLCGMIIAGATVHLWNTSFVYFSFLLGSAVWMLQKQCRSADQAFSPRNPR